MKEFTGCIYCEHLDNWVYDFVPFTLGTACSPHYDQRFNDVNRFYYDWYDHNDGDKK